MWGFSAVAFSLNFSIYVAGSPLARPIGRLGPFPLSLVGLFFTKPGENLVTCPYHSEPCVEGSCISGNQKKGTTFIRKPDNKKGTLLLSSYAISGRMLLTWLLFRSRAPVVVLGSKLLLPMRSSWPVFPGLDQDLFPPRFSSFFGIRFQNGAKECIV